MKLNTNTILIALLGIFAIAIIACFPITLMTLPLLKSDKPGDVNTIATFQSVMTQTAYAPTQYAPTPFVVTATPVPPTSTPVRPANTAIPTAASYCDWVSFIKDVSIPDGSKLYPGEVFTKTWRLQNRGTCTWTPGYMLVFTGGESMGSTTAMGLPAYVDPGQAVDISVTLTAPDDPGLHTGYWMLRNSAGVLFGTGWSADEPFYVTIKSRSAAALGTLTGNLSYPSEFIPAMRVTAFSLTNGTAYFTDTAKDQGIYALNVPPGTYYIVSYPYQGTPGNIGQAASWTMGGGTFSGGYTKAVQCGLGTECLDHALIGVAVDAGQAVSVNPGDWYAPDGSFPRMPQ
jgi:hypothetical protein